MCTEEQDINIGDVVELLWDDAACWYTESTESDWRDSEDTLTYGIVVKKTPRSVFLASEIQVDNGAYRTVTRVPWAYIQAYRVLAPSVVEP